jgi:hypothetical protein
MARHPSLVRMRPIAATRRADAILAAFAPAAVIALASLAACDAQRSGRMVATEGAGATWRWRAEKMEVSALSTPFPAASGAGAAASIDAHVEFFDADGDETKAIGTLAVTVLFDGNQVGRLVADLEGMGGHTRFWDRATRSYSLRIPLSVDPPAGRTVALQATFDGVDGARMSASRDLRWPERGK